MSSDAAPDEPGGATPDGNASGWLFRDEQGRVLLVKPSYQVPWVIPGGGIERGESPRDAAIRELREELAIDRTPGPLLCVDHRPAPGDGRSDALRFLFDGGVLTPADTASFRLDPAELLDWRFVEPADLDEFVIPLLARRLRSVLAADGPVYLEDGRVPTR